MMDLQGYLKSLNEEEILMVNAFKEIFSEVQPERVLEIGSGWGIFSRAVMEYSNANLVTIDKQSLETLGEFKQRIEGFENRITIIAEVSSSICFSSNL